MKKIIILIPVLNGESTLPHTLETCCSQNYGNYKIVVSNNWSDDRTEEVIVNFQSRFSNIYYIKPPQRLGMSAHWEFAIKEVINDDAFLIIIGSDDALMPNALQYANGLFNIFDGIQALAWSLSYYYYPDLPDKRIANSCSLFLGRNIEVRNSLSWLRHVGDGKAFYHLGLINVYHGFVHNSLLRNLAAKFSGSLINSMSPDIYLSLALCSLEEKYIFIREPLSLNCISSNSTGFSGFSPLSDGKLAENFFRESEKTLYKNLAVVPDLGIAHLDCLFQLRDAGFLPEDFQINIKSIIGRAAISVYINHRGHPKFEEYLSKVRSMAIKFQLGEYIEDILNLVQDNSASLSSKIDLTFFNEPYSYSRLLPKEIVANCYQASLLAQEVIIADENARRSTLNHIVNNLNEAVRNNYQKETEEAMNDFVKNTIQCHGAIWTDRDFLTKYLKHISFRPPPFDPVGFLGALSKNTAYSEWLASHFWSNERCYRLLASIKSASLLPQIHILLALDGNQQGPLSETIDDLVKQAHANWRLTVLSDLACPDTGFKPSNRLEWMQISSSPADAITAVAKTSPAEWFFCISAGVHLSPTFTLLTSLRLRERPECLVLYTDEDIFHNQQEHLQPKLKPDINIDLLRSSPYVGAAVLIRKPLMLDPRIAILPPGLARNYSAALLAIEQSPNTVEHIDEILVHVPELLAEEYAGTALAPLLIQQHLTRCGALAEVSEGSLAGTLRIDYQLPAKPPKVSILILIRDSLNAQACLKTLLEKTDYPDFEVLVMINDGNANSVIQAFFAELSSRDARVRVLHGPQKNNYSAAYNFAASQARGDFLLFLNDDVLVLQENWLAHLTATGIRKEVGAVGCCLISANQKIKYTGLILGLNGSVGSINVDLPLSEPGYMGRAQLTQNFSAVSAACMLVRKNLFFEVGGLDEKDFSTFYYDADFCLKLGERGYQMVWTPFVRLTQQDNSSDKDQQDSQWNSDDPLSRKAFIRKWRSCLGRDPAYNRYLSLRQREWVIDGDFDVPWHPDLEPLPRIVAQAPDKMGVGQYRMIGPLNELTNSGRICSFLLPVLSSAKRFLPYVSELVRAKPTVLFLQNAFTRFHIDDLQNYAELLPDVFRVFGQDDIVFSVPQKSSVRKHFGKDTKARIRKAVALCHRAIVTTEPIAEAMRGMADDIRVVPNYLERSRWGNLQPPRNERRKLRVGWAGAQQHQGDLEFILPVVEATANEVDWIFMGMCPPKLRYHVAEAYNAVPFDQYPAALAALDLDLAIAPLEINRFNTAKSNLRLLEYGAVGYPVICTDIEPYRNAPVTRVPNNPKAWIDAIRARVHDLDATRAAGEQLREWVLSKWMLDQHLDEWMKALLPD